MGFQFLIKLCCQGKRKGGRGEDQIEFQRSNQVQGRCWRDNDVSFGSRCTGLTRKHRNSCLTLNGCTVYPRSQGVTFQGAVSRGAECRCSSAPNRELTPCERSCTQMTPQTAVAHDLNQERDQRNSVKHRMFHELEGGQCITVQILTQLFCRPERWRRRTN